MTMNLNSQPSFTSSIIPLKTNNRNISDYFKPLDQYFECKAFNRESVKELVDKIDLNQAGIAFHDEGLLVVGKDKSADNFIGRLLKKIDSNVKYTDDVPELKLDGPVIDLEI